MREGGLSPTKSLPYNFFDQMPTLIPLLTEFEKEHISERQALPEQYLGLSDDEMDARIAAARAGLGNRLVILGHHYQRDEVIKFADYTGDSFRLASQIADRPDADYIVFCGVHFMAESADVLCAALKRTCTEQWPFQRIIFARFNVSTSTPPNTSSGSHTTISSSGMPIL